MDGSWPSELVALGWTADELMRAVYRAGAGAGLQECDWDDAFQEVAMSLMRVFQGGIPPNLQSPDVMRRYVLVAVRNQISSSQRKQKRVVSTDPAILEDTPARPDVAPEPPELTPAQWEMIRNHLPTDEPILFEILRLRAQRMTQKAIAERLGISQPTVCRGLVACEECLTPEVITKIIQLADGGEPG